MNALAPITRKLDPLIRRLSTDKDGEVVACVRAIERQLAKAGLSFHDLADRLAAPAVATEDDALPVPTTPQPSSGSWRATAATLRRARSTSWNPCAESSVNGHPGRSRLLGSGRWWRG